MIHINTNHHAKQKCVFVGEIEKLKTANFWRVCKLSELGEAVLARKERR